MEIHCPRALGRGNHPANVEILENEGNKPGRIRIRVVANVTAGSLKRMMRERVAAGAVFDTDGSGVYPRGACDFADHCTLMHRLDKYMGREGQATNGVGSVFSRMKRIIFGALLGWI